MCTKCWLVLASFERHQIMQVACRALLDKGSATPLENHILGEFRMGTIPKLREGTNTEPMHRNLGHLIVPPKTKMKTDTKGFWQVPWSHGQAPRENPSGK